MSYTPDQIIAKMISELTQDEAIELAESGWWNLLDSKQVAFLQWNQSKLCMPFSEFHRCLECWVGRPVFTHELASPSGRKMLEEEAATGIHPSLNEIMAQIPPDKLITFTPDR
jgi:hypothetical protein